MATDIASKIRKLLDAKHWSVYELSKQSGVPQSTLSGILNKNRSPRLCTLEAIGHAFEMEPEELLLIGKAPSDKEALTPYERGLVLAARREQETGAKTLKAYAMYLYPQVFEHIDK